MWHRFQKYGLIGCLNAALDFAIFIMGVKLFDFPPLIAHIIAWCIAVQLSYIMNSFFTFNKSFKQTWRLKPWFKFILSGLFALLVSSLILYLCLSYFNIYIAKIIAIIASYIVGFSLSQFVVFKEE